MEKMFLKKLPAVFVSAAIIGGGIALACADGDWPEYGTSDFTPEAFVSGKYSPFFYSEYGYYYGIGYDDNHLERFNDNNVSDWKSYLGNGADKMNLPYLLTEAPVSIIDSISDFLNKKITVLPDSVGDFSSLQNKANDKLNNFITYLQLAKEAEGYATAPIDNYWGDDPKPAKPAGTFDYLQPKLLAGFNGVKDPFIKERYWFQLERFYFFNADPQKAIDLFEDGNNGFDKNILYYRTLAYAAGAYYKQKNYSKANYYYSLVYNNCDALKTVAHYSFHPQEESDWQATLAMAKSNDEKAALWQMLGIFYSDEVRSINEIYRLDPASDKLDLLLVRAINKEEQKTNALSERGAYSDTVHRLNPVLLALISNADAGKTHNPFLWLSAAGYLNMLSAKYDLAGQYFTKAEAKIGNAQLQRWQLRLLKLLNKTAAATVIDNKFESSVLSDLQWLNDFKYDANNPFRYDDAFSFIRHKLAAKYKKQHEIVKSELFESDIDFYADNASIEKMKTFLQKPDKSDYEKIAMSLYRYKLGDLYEYQAILAALDDRIDEAITLMKNAPEASKSQLLGNPFNGNIKDCHDCDHVNYKGTPYAKLSFLEKIKEMEDKIKAGDDAYNNALLVGNAFYNMSHYGNARAFSESSIITGSFSPVDIDSIFLKPLTGMKAAAGYYQKAFSAAQNAEQKAKCTYLLAKCERNDWYNQNIYYNPDYERSWGEYDGMLNIKSMRNFKTLKDKYSNTKYYQEAIKECGYLSYYSRMY